MNATDGEDYWRGYAAGRAVAHADDHANEKQLVRIANYFGGDATKGPAADRTIAGFVIAQSEELRGAAEAFLTRLAALEPHLVTLHALAQNRGMPWPHGDYAAQKERLMAALGPPK